MPLKRMEWMSVKSTKTRVIPGVFVFSFCYSSYKTLGLTKADPGILACNNVAGTSDFVSGKEYQFVNISPASSGQHLGHVASVCRACQQFFMGCRSCTGPQFGYRVERTTLAALVRSNGLGSMGVQDIYRGWQYSCSPKSISLQG